MHQIQTEITLLLVFIQLLAVVGQQILVVQAAAIVALVRLVKAMQEELPLQHLLVAVAVQEL